MGTFFYQGKPYPVKRDTYGRLYIVIDAHPGYYIIPQTVPDQIDRGYDYDKPVIVR